MTHDEMKDELVAISAESGSKTRTRDVMGAGYWAGDVAGEQAAGRGVRAAFGEDKYERLAAIKRRHDPENVFRGNHNIKPLATRPS